MISPSLFAINHTLFQTHFNITFWTLSRKPFCWHIANC